MRASAANVAIDTGCAQDAKDRRRDRRAGMACASIVVNVRSINLVAVVVAMPISACMVKTAPEPGRERALLCHSG